LLEQPDQTLQRWLLGEGSDVDPELQQIVQIMRKQGLERL
jgi:succinate dehydrogenase flavin-adding protein (antitoxin of CptAB toxin-antitoxin module)